MKDKVIYDVEFSKIVAKYCNMSISIVNEIRAAEGEIIKDLLKRGYTIRVSPLGKFHLREVSARKESLMHDISTGEVRMMKPSDCHQTPKFTFNPKLKKEIAELTKGRLI